jgi:hypothetical protein
MGVRKAARNGCLSAFLAYQDNPRGECDMKARGVKVKQVRTKIPPYTERVPVPTEPVTKLSTQNGVVLVPQGVAMTQEEAGILTSCVARSLNENEGWPEILFVTLDLASNTGIVLTADEVLIRFRFEAELPVGIGTGITISPYQNN